MKATNDERLEAWNSLLMFSGGLEASSEERARRHTAALGYTIRSLHKGRVPDARIVADTLNGERSVPSCGRVECVFDLLMGDHVH